MSTDAETPLYLIPGTMCDERLWRYLWPMLEDRRPRHLPIPPGENIAELVEGLLAQLPAAPVNLFGFSLGGYLAAALAVTHPERIARLFICANTLRALPESELRQRRQLLDWVARHGYSGISDRKIAAMLAPANRGRGEIADIMRSMDATLGERALVAQLRATSERADLADGLVDLAAPATFCFGEEDELVNRPWLENLQRRRPGLRVTQIPGAGHMLPLERPQALAAEIRLWLDTPPAAQLP
ncbi:Pimeloyl-ACP methyl ester carboxylesterase [Microbulbifer donghaiensis]|uniref:Pimeloyl-ACP methyl ester carboxylesterase n=1 Tax=Microbulbifer donghaiensis TaxID=494016 RepID=A0A1M4X5D1_9GAMM|nr:alpha/beta hydrolase [Microbulbifer donghaiensis]SHE88651.1 Pimeloyl-ACP methyl ester carboxylesterase [Microbulbifer donghaiensis]